MKELRAEPRIYQKQNARFMSSPGDDLIPTRHSLLNRLKDLDDQDSWKEFFDRYWKLIYGVAIKSGLTEVEAQEVVQETVIAVSKKMPQFNYDPAIGSFKGWLMKQTHWRIKDQLRKRQREASAIRGEPLTTSTSFLENIPDPDSRLERLWDEEWEKHLMDLALSRVKRKVQAKHYQIFDLCTIKRWPLQKVAENLNVNIGQVYLARHRVGAIVKKEISIVKKELKDLERKLL
ncbi:MAG: sigma-70 family RNA polymerase sigma factor [Verrucomicrobia subdivision 3 bacterium]|nr:sigma-70 family RNA polymerase sigma factor [Limisphaerales bacterium]